MLVSCVHTRYPTVPRRNLEHMRYTFAMKRRDFLGAVGALPALAVPPQTPAARPARPGLKLGTVTYEIARDWDVPTIIKNLTDVGMDAVELRTTHKHGVEISLPSSARAEVRKRFDDSPVKIGGLGTTCEYHSPDQAVVRTNIDETKEWVKLAHDIGSPSVKVRPNGLPKDVPEEKTLEQIGKALARVRRIRAAIMASTSSSRCTGPRPRGCPASAEFSTMAATIPACASAGTRIRAICSMAGSRPLSGW